MIGYNEAMHETEAKVIAARSRSDGFQVTKK